MKRALKISLLTACGVGAMLLATLFSAFLWSVETESGTHFVWRHARTFLPPSVEIRTLKGRLAGPLEVGGVKITHSTFLLEIDQFELDWHPWRLWNRVLEVESIALHGVRYTHLGSTHIEDGTEKPKKETPPATLPKNIELPFGIAVHIGAASLHDFQFNTATEETSFEIFSAQLKADMDNQALEITSLAVESSLYEVEGNALLHTHADFPLQAELKWQVPVPDYPTLHGNTRINGTLREITISNNIAPPYAIQATVQLTNPVENLAFEGSALLNPLLLQSLHADLPPVTTQIEIRGKGTPGAITFNLDGWAEKPDMGRINTTLAGGFKAGTITIDALKMGVAHQPAQATARGTIELSTSPILDLTLGWEQLQWPLHGDPLLTSPLGALQLSGTWEKLHAALEIAVGDRGSIEGYADREDDVLDIALLWHALQWPLHQPKVKSSTGHITLGGEINAYTFNAQADVAVPDQIEAKFLLQGQGSLEGAQVATIDISTLDGSIAGDAGLRWAPELQGDIHLSGQGLNPAGVLQEWPGKLEFSLSAQGGMDDGTPHVEVENFSTQGHLRDYAVALQGAGSYAEGIATLKRLDLSSGASRVEVSGTLGETLDVQWQIQSKDLDSLLPTATGRLNGAGTLAGPVKEPRITATLSAAGVAYQNYRLNSLSLDADVDVAGKTQSNIVLKANDAHAAGVELQDLLFSAYGTPAAHTLTLEANTSAGGADIVLQGDVNDLGQPEISWNFTLNQAELSYPGLDPWILQHPFAGHISASKATLAQNCWGSGAALLCLNGTRTTHKVEADFTLSNLPFSYLSPYIPPELEVQGNLNGHGLFAQGGESDPFVQIALTTSAVRLLAHTESTEQEKSEVIMEFEPADFRVLMEHGALQAQLEIPLSAPDIIAIKGNISQGQSPLMERALETEITANIDNLDFIADLLPEVQKLSGALSGTMSITGSLAEPLFYGKLTLREGAAELERPGLSLQDIQIELSGTGAKGVRLNAHALSGEGKLNIDATSDFRANADISVKGKNFRVINTLEAQVDASPDLSIAMRQNRIDVGGELILPKAQITIKELPEASIKVSEDQIIVEATETTQDEASRKREIHARVRTVLGDNVRFNGFGLKARIQGELLVIDRPGEATTASGELHIEDGEYRAYGQGLVIEKGRLLFSGGPINQPGLDVRAVRRPKEGITVGVQVRGSLKKPDFRLFSDPNMTQGNQLSYLVLGRPLSGTSGSEGSALSRASLALGLRGGNVVAEKIGGSMGLDQFGIDAGEAGSDSSPENTSFVIGKYLSPKLYISYGLGLFNQTSSLQLHYTISKHWKFMTESATETRGADLIYVIETE